RGAGGGGGSGARAAAGTAIDRADLMVRRGRVGDVIGLIIEASGLEAAVGEVCMIEAGRDRPPVPAEVVGFRDSRTLLMPLGEMSGIGPGKPVAAEGEAFRVPVGAKLLGQVVDAFGRPLDGTVLAPNGTRSVAAGP